MNHPSPLRRSPAAKAMAFLLCALFLTASLCLGFLTLFHWDDLWLRGDYHQSDTATREMYPDTQRILELATLKQAEERGTALTYSEKERMKALEDAFSQKKTNFRYQLHDQAGKLLLDNLDGNRLEDLTPKRSTLHDTLYMGDLLHREVVLEYGLDRSMPVEDQYTVGMASYLRLQHDLPVVAVLTVLSLLGGLSLLVFLLRGAGWRRDGTLATGWQEWLPYELYLAGDALFLVLLYGGAEALLYPIAQPLDPSLLAGLSVFAFGLAVLGIAFLLTTAVRLKTHTLWRTSLIGRLYRGVRSFARELVGNLPIAVRLAALFLLYLAGSALTARTVVLIPLYQGFVLWYLCRWLLQWRQVEDGIARIAGGDVSFKIDTSRLFPDLRRHAERLNDLGESVNLAVAEQIKNERFKAELITNVSHDLKTPLTSIINYVGLLKVLPMENPLAAEYIDVLDRKSQRLRRLTEDLVEASKASTGTLPVQLERLGMGQLLLQALGEYEERFQFQRLEVIFLPPEAELYVWGDGRHLWRVVDNLFSNCAKYALEGTRVYLELTRQERRILLTVKNISRQALNLPPERLMERFVRGEESRSTEGSGLGLSIAQSLTELQQGSFRMEIDGDLFKVLLSLPEAPALPETSSPATEL